MAKKKYRLKKKNIAIAICLVIIITIGIVALVKWKKEMDYQKTYEYKLLQLGYKEDDIEYLLDNLPTNEIDDLLLKDRNDYIVPFMKQEYFKKQHLEEYLKYLEENPKEDMSKVVAIINVGANKKFYDDSVDADMTRDMDLLMNKYHKLPNDYEPEDLVNIKNWYAYGSSKMREEAYERFIDMFNAAKEEGITLIINSAYRSYADQEKVYNSYIVAYGQEKTDKLAARPGYSEHQTGLAIDIITYGANASTFDTTEAFNWLQNNAFKYGYILRYPKDKEDLTGYTYESWHYRYVGDEIAKYIHMNNITYDEYYAYFIEK